MQLLGPSLPGWGQNWTQSPKLAPNVAPGLKIGPQIQIWGRFGPKTLYKTPDQPPRAPGGHYWYLYLCTTCSSSDLRELVNCRHPPGRP